MTIPKTKKVLVLRTDFSNDAFWQTLCATAMTPSSDFGFLPNVEFLSDKSFQNKTTAQILADLPSGYNHSFLFVADNLTFGHKDMPVLCIDLADDPGRTFRIVPSEMWGVENNLSISNMEFHDFADNVDPDGIFRDF